MNDCEQKTEQNCPDTQVHTGTHKHVYICQKLQATHLQWSRSGSDKNTMARAPNACRFPSGSKEFGKHRSNFQG